MRWLILAFSFSFVLLTGCSTEVEEKMIGEEFCYKYNGAPSVLNSGGLNSDKENADIMARKMTAAQCIGYAISYGLGKKNGVSLESEKFLSTHVAGMSEIIEKECPARELTTNAGYQKEYQYGKMKFAGDAGMVLTRIMKRSEFDARLLACGAVLRHFIEMEAKINKRK